MRSFGHLQKGANRKEVTMFTFTIRYVRYALATPTTIGFGVSVN
jgi:hypothetical protein